MEDVLDPFQYKIGTATIFSSNQGFATTADKPVLPVLSSVKGSLSNVQALTGAAALLGDVLGDVAH